MYPDELKIAVLQARELGLTQQEISDQYNVPISTVGAWTNLSTPIGINGYHLKQLVKEREALADRLENELHSALDHAENVRSIARYSEVAAMIKAAVPAMRLLRNQSTDNVAVATEEERDSKLVEIIERARLRRIEEEQGEAVDTL